MRRERTNLLRVVKRSFATREAGKTAWFYRLFQVCYAKEHLMEFYEKLQELRKKKGLTQEELAEILYVSRTAVSKWESGRGFPNIESLKAISVYFQVSIDNLLSGEELLFLADKDTKQREKQMRNRVFGLLDCSMLFLLFLPLFGQRGGDVIREVSLLSLTGTPLYIRIPYFLFVFAITLVGVLTLVFQNKEFGSRTGHFYLISVGLGALGTVGFMLTLQPYAALFTFVFLAVKVLILIKGR